MTDNPYNCETCLKKGTEDCPYDVICYNEDGCDFIQPFKRTEEFKKFAYPCGLMCHPKAREYLNKEVIEELEKYGITRIGIEGVIKLLKDRVKK